MGRETQFSLMVVQVTEKSFSYPIILFLYLHVVTMVIALRPLQLSNLSHVIQIYYFQIYVYSVMTTVLDERCSRLWPKRCKKLKCSSLTQRPSYRSRSRKGRSKVVMNHTRLLFVIRCIDGFSNSFVLFVLFCLLYPRYPSFPSMAEFL